MAKTQEPDFFDYSKVRNASLVLRALNNPLRQRIIALLLEKEKLTVTEIYTEVRIVQSVASQQLAILLNAGIVNNDRDGKFIIYSIATENSTVIKNLVEELSAFCKK